MKYTPVAITVHNNRDRMAGELRAAIDVDIDGQQGKATFLYVWDKRDVVREELYTEPHIAGAMKNAIGGDGPMAKMSGLTQHSSFGDAAKLEEYEQASTEAVWTFE